MDILSNRIKFRLSQAELAASLNVTPSAISKWENGKAQPSITMLRKLEGIFSEERSEGLYTSIVEEYLQIDRRRSIDGNWKTTWSYVDREVERTNIDTLKLRTTGLLVEGEGKNKDYHYKIIGHLTIDGILTGNWFSILPKSKHHGVFIIDIERDGESGTGMWLGTHVKKKPILHGIWEWKKISDE